MTRYVFLVGAIASLVVGLIVTLTSMAYAGLNLNSSKSNIYRLVYSGVVTSTQATAILAELDNVSPKGNVDDATLRAILRKHLGAGKYESIRKLILRPADGTRKTMSIIILDNPADEPQAIAVSDEGMPADKSSKGTKSKK